MTSASYLPPKICWLPGGYGCAVVVPKAALAQTLRRSSGQITLIWRVWRNGECVQERFDELSFVDGRLDGPDPGPFLWQPEPSWDIAGGFLEFSAETKDAAPTFVGGEIPTQYAAYFAPNRKSFFTCVQYKYGEPRIISQIATFGRFLDGYPVIRLDRRRGLGESIAFVNPYKMPLLATVKTTDNRTLPRFRVGALSAAHLSLASLLRDDENDWCGSIQITASNRVVTYTIKHQFDDPTILTKAEHMDPFRADPTHFPAFRVLRQWIGQRIVDRRRSAHG